MLDVEYKQCILVGWINADNSDDEILVVTENRVLSKRIKDWVKVTVS